MQHDAAFVAALVIERDLIDHLIMLDGGLTDNAGGALHGVSLSERGLKTIIEPKLQKSKGTQPHPATVQSLKFYDRSINHQLTC